MRNLIVLLLLVLASCNHRNNTPQEQAQAQENFDWLLGTWARTNEKPDRNTFESWKRISGSELQGESYTMQAADTVWKETVRLTKVDTTWRYEVMQKGEEKTTSFQLINIGPQGFTCENKANEFPKKITYSRTGDKMLAVISGGDMEIPFEFRKLANQ